MWYLLAAEHTPDSLSPRPFDLTQLAEGDLEEESKTSFTGTSDGGQTKSITLKRKREEACEQLDRALADLTKDVEVSNKSWAVFERSRPSQPVGRFAGIQLPRLIYPKSIYTGWNPPLPRTFESDALKDLWVDRPRGAPLIPQTAAGT